MDDLLYLYRMSLDRGLIGTKIYLLRIPEIPDNRILNINGNINQDRAFPSRIRNIKGFSENSGDVIDILKDSTAPVISAS